MDIPQLHPHTEWYTRVELAAASRVLAHFGFASSDCQICARLPDERDAYLIRPLPLLLEETTASTFVKYDLFGNARQDARDQRDRRELVLHGGVFAARLDVEVTLQAGSFALAGVSSQRHGLLPLTYHALPFLGWIAYLDVARADNALEQRDAILASLHGRDIALVRDAGAIVLGRTIGGVVTSLCQLDLACQIQLAALAGGGDPFAISDAVVRETQHDLGGRPFFRTGGARWRGMLRLADRLYPDYRT